MFAPIFQLDAFASRRFTGNPAAVIQLEDFLPDDVLQALAAENNLAETAFIVADGGEYLLLVHANGRSPAVRPRI